MPAADDAQQKSLANIWLTSKTRMRSEERYKLYSLISHLLLSYFALLMIGITIFSKVLQNKIDYFYEINIGIAAIIFSVSLILYGFKFDETARLHRDCYLRLQKLMSCGMSLEDKIALYNEILSGYPNHADKDFDDLIIDRSFSRRKQIWDASGPIKHTPYMIIKRIFRWVGFWGFILLIVSLPAYFLFEPLLDQSS